MYTKVVKLTGTADNINLNFTQIGGTDGKHWTASVPPDTVDGWYAVSLTATDENGMQAHWTGGLYMFNGACHLTIDTKKFVFWYKPFTTLQIDSRIMRLKILGCCHDV